MTVLGTGLIREGQRVLPLSHANIAVAGMRDVVTSLAIHSPPGRCRGRARTRPAALLPVQVWTISTRPAKLSSPTGSRPRFERRVALEAVQHLGQIGGRDLVWKAVPGIEPADDH